jgi:hypothetical protein
VKPVELVLERAEGVRRVGSGWMVSCPLPEHGRGFGDRKPSVSVTEGDDSRALVNCQAGCQTEDIVAAWGLNMSDLFENRKGHRGGGVLYLPENNVNRSTGHAGELRRLRRATCRVPQEPRAEGVSSPRRARREHALPG